MPCRPEDQTGARPAFTYDSSKPVSDAAGAAASALASASLLLRDSDPAYADTCLSYARRLFTLAAAVRLLGHAKVASGLGTHRKLPRCLPNCLQLHVSLLRTVLNTLCPPPPPQNEGKYSDSYQSATYAYQSSSNLDDLAFAVRPAAWPGTSS